MDPWQKFDDEERPVARRSGSKPWIWRAPPNWPTPPPGWTPPSGWKPPPEWPRPPRGWAFWVPVTALPIRPPPTGSVGQADTAAFYAANQPPAVLEVHIEPATRRGLVWELRWVMVAFLVPAVGSAIVPLVQHGEGVNDINRFPTFVPGNPLVNMVLGIVTYVGVGALVPLSLLLLSRTGDTPSSLGLGLPGWSLDIWPAIGLAGLSFVTEIAVLIPLAPVIAHSHLVNQPAVGRVPDYYVVYGLVISAVTAVTEEVLVNGYLIVRLEQLGWRPQRALLLSVALRTSYHIYYGIAFFLVIPFGFYVTRSFQKHRRLTRPITAHFLYDAALTTVAILV